MGYSKFVKPGGDSLQANYAGGKATQQHRFLTGFNIIVDIVGAHIYSFTSFFY